MEALGDGLKGEEKGARLTVVHFFRSRARAHGFIINRICRVLPGFLSG